MSDGSTFVGNERSVNGDFNLLLLGVVSKKYVFQIALNNVFILHF